MYWFWDTTNEQADMDTLRREILRLDTGVLPESPEVEQCKWSIEASLMQRKSEEKSSPGPPSGSNSATKGAVRPIQTMTKVENSTQYPDQMVLVFSHPKRTAPDTGPARKDSQNGGILRLPPPTRKCVVVQANSNISKLDFYSDYHSKNNIKLDGFEYVVGDFSIRIGVASRGNTQSYIVIRAMFIPCELDPEAPIYRQVEEALGLGTRFPCTSLPIKLDQYADVLPKQFGPMHEAVEVVEVLVKMLRSR
mmetsp:Transcript_2798/g.6547  ORF Transcript_2798/g.6547 Transcript_2798/m.6547 type:complete len:250 (+) Transcript_2798:537-1286(+)|eukprot:CAMPEP_0171490908 /NCGR_PEP_ID=MMETSP0958-20121227/3569_1 /TAXON_ID=87120 /ORGANISM="Aurantiochytrium limacinum, Strain ATCCMYA-1381" /LENGTH=249 /DNA_ID=CAMNT_0012024275 /DNA_START=67 /DNA_END=816 /DNA_ORIENTATION=+